VSKLGKLSLVALVSTGLVGAIGMQFLRSETPRSPVAGLPKLVDLGAKTCIPCKRMAPILEGLKKDYAGKFDVEFIDVSVKGNVPLAEKYKIKLIPTQVFLDAKGKELWRHEGFLGREAILGKWKELGFKFGSAGCFHQGNFTSVENLKKWLERNPFETGKLISIQQALSGKMKLSPQQIKKACEIGECKPK